MVLVSKEDDLLCVLRSLIFNPHFDLSIESGIIVHTPGTGLGDLLSLIFMLTLFEVNNPIRQMGNPRLTDNNWPKIILC